MVLALEENLKKYFKAYIHRGLFSIFAEHEILLFFASLRLLSMKFFITLFLAWKSFCYCSEHEKASYGPKILEKNQSFDVTDSRKNLIQLNFL